MARCSIPARGLHGEDRRRPRGARCDRHSQVATDNLHSIAEAKNQPVENLTAVIFDRDRHGELIKEVRRPGARIRLIPDGDVAGAISTAWPDSGADVLFGIGGTPEGVISAALFAAWAASSRACSGPANEPNAKLRSTPATT